jgi:hypothetical protein
MLVSNVSPSIPRYMAFHNAIAPFRDFLYPFITEHDRRLVAFYQAFYEPAMTNAFIASAWMEQDWLPEWFGVVDDMEVVEEEEQAVGDL